LPPPPAHDQFYDEVPSNPQDPPLHLEELPPPPEPPGSSQLGGHKMAVVEEAEEGEMEEPEEEEEDAAEDEVDDDELPPDSEAPAPQQPLDLEKETTGSDGQDSEPPDVQVEVAQLQDMVNACLKTALKGCPCTFLQNGERTSTRYFVDEALEYLSVASCQGTSHTEVVCPISGIQDIFCVPEDGEAAFPHQVISPLSAAEKELLLMVVFQGRPGEQPSKFCLLMESRDGRDAFMEAMRVLCVASRFNSDKPLRQGGDRGAGPTAAPHRGHAVLKSSRSADSCGSSASRRKPAMPCQQVSVRFFMRSIGIKAMLPAGAEQNAPLPPLIRDGVAPYISAYGYRPKGDLSWEVPPGNKTAYARPTLAIRVRQHIEAAKHTWYIVESTLRMEGGDRVPRLDWLAPRRLAHLRQHLHDPIKNTLGPDAYGRVFDGASFAHRLGLPGTTAQLHRWCNALVDCINTRTAPPLIVATTLHFLEAPVPWTGGVDIEPAPVPTPTNGRL